MPCGARRTGARHVRVPHCLLRHSLSRVSRERLLRICMYHCMYPLKTTARTCCNLRLRVNLCSDKVVNTVQVHVNRVNVLLYFDSSELYQLT